MHHQHLRYNLFFLTGADQDTKMRSVDETVNELVQPRKRGKSSEPKNTKIAKGSTNAKTGQSLPPKKRDQCTKSKLSKSSAGKFPLTTLV